MQRVFISFDYNNDAELKNALVGQAKYPNSPFEIADWSVKEPFSGNWQAKVQERMKRTSVVVVTEPTPRRGLQRRSRSLNNSASRTSCWRAGVKAAT